ncbi:MAG: DUF6242 domain-containing protein [Paludibacter sp.]
MKFSPFKFILFSLFVVFLTSCLGTTDTTTVSIDPSFSSLTFAADDSVAGMSTTVFSLVEVDPFTKDSMITNLDSMIYNADINDVIPTFTFKSTSAQYLIYEDDTITLNGTDTIDFSKPVKVKNYAANLDSSKVYTVKVNVHKVEPKLYVWSKVSGDVDSHNATSQKAVYFHDSIFYYLNNGTNGYLYKSKAGQFDSGQQLTNFPASTSLNDLQVFKGKLFLTQDDDKIYSSSDGSNWAIKSLENYNFKSLVFALDGNLWAVVQSKADLSYRFATSGDGNEWIIKGLIPSGFPVKGFTALSFLSRVGKQKALVIGGYSADNSILKSRWSSEDGAYWVDFSTENHTLDTLAIGASVISYDKKLLAFGLKADTAYIRVSIDEGLSWQKPSSKYNQLREIAGTDTTYCKLQSLSAIVMNPGYFSGVNPESSRNTILNSNRIFLVGIKSGSDNRFDVWTGKLNSLNFLRQ